MQFTQCHVFDIKTKLIYNNYNNWEGDALKTMEIKTTKKNALQQKSIDYFTLSGILFLVFTTMFCISALKYNNVQFPILASGICISSYFAYLGFELKQIIKKQNFVQTKYLCSDIQPSGYRRQNLKITFVNTKTKEPFIYNTTKKNNNFTVGFEYNIWFRKTDYKKSNDVLVVELSQRQEFAKKTEIRKNQ